METLAHFQHKINFGKIYLIKYHLNLIKYHLNLIKYHLNLLKQCDNYKFASH